MTPIITAFERSPDRGKGLARDMRVRCDGDGAAQVERIGILKKYPNLSAYVARGEARPAYKRAFDDQLAVFTGKPPAS
jgi:glutathione S-transferase